MNADKSADTRMLTQRSSEQKCSCCGQETSVAHWHLLLIGKEHAHKHHSSTWTMAARIWLGSDQPAHLQPCAPYGPYALASHDSNIMAIINIISSISSSSSSSSSIDMTCRRQAQREGRQGAGWGSDLYSFTRAMRSKAHCSWNTISCSRTSWGCDSPAFCSTCTLIPGQGRA